MPGGHHQPSIVRQQVEHAHATQRTLDHAELVCAPWFDLLLARGVARLCWRGALGIICTLRAYTCRLSDLLHDLHLAWLSTRQTGVGLLERPVAHFVGCEENLLLAYVCCRTVVGNDSRCGKYNAIDAKAQLAVVLCKSCALAGCGGGFGHTRQQADAHISSEAVCRVVEDAAFDATPPASPVICSNLAYGALWQQPDCPGFV